MSSIESMKKKLVAGNNVTPISMEKSLPLTPQERQQAFAAWITEGEQKFGATIIVKNPITIIDEDGSFAYTPPKIKIALIEGWTPDE